MFSYNELAQMDHKYIWHPFTQMKSWCQEEPLIIVKGQGNKLIDYNGKEYIDAYSSLWCNVHGHNVEELNKAIIEQLQYIAHSTLLGASNIPSIFLAEKLISIAPKGITKVFYSDNGATAVEIGLKMAYQYWKHIEGKPRKKFITFKGAYHGDTIGSVSLGGIDIFHNIFQGLLFDTIKISATETIRNNKIITLKESGDLSLNLIEKALKKHKGEIISIVIEPKVFGAMGMIVQPLGFVKAVREMADKYDTLLFCDEVATGFGRTGDMFASSGENVCPDIMSIAKGLTGGYLPVAATLVKEHIYNAFLGNADECKTFFHGHTYTGNQLGCAVSLSSLDLMEKNKTIQNVRKIIPVLAKKLQLLEQAKENVGEVRQSGLMIGIEIVKNKKTRECFSPELLYGHRIIMEMRKYGVLTRNLGDVVVLNPPLSITEKEIDIIFAALEKSISDVLEK